LADVAFFTCSSAWIAFGRVDCTQYFILVSYSFALYISKGTFAFALFSPLVGSANDALRSDLVLHE